LNGKDGALHLTRTEKLAPCTAMAPEEEPQQDHPGQEAGQDQAPPGQDSEKSLCEDQPQREYLEAAKQHDPRGKEPGRHDPKGHKGRPVEYGVLKSYPGVVYSAAGSLSPSSTAAPRRTGVSGRRSRRHTGSSEGGGHA